MENTNLAAFLNTKKEQAADHLKRNSFSWVFGIIIPLYFFGTPENIKLLAWKICVVCAGCIVFHVVRKQMFPYIDPADILVNRLMVEDADNNQRNRAVVFLAECILLGLLAHAIISSIAGGL